MIDLPMDGVWFLNGAGAVLGERGHWQCGRRKSAEGLVIKKSRLIFLLFNMALNKKAFKI